MYWFTPNIHPIPTGGPGLRQEPQAPSMSAMWIAETQEFEP